MLTADQFRVQTKPAFDTVNTYPVSSINFYLGLAYQMLVPARWGTVLDWGAQLFTAHFLALDQLAIKGAKNGGVPGSVIGIVSGAHVDKVGYERDIKSVMEEDAGHWAMTIYGLQYLRLVRQMGMGPIQIGASAPFVDFYGGAWPGVINGLDGTSN